MRKPVALHLSRLLLPLALILALRPAIAHEFWIEPQQFRPAPGAKVPVRLLVGQQFKGNSIPWLGENYSSFYMADARGTESLRGVLGDDPAVTLTARAPGRLWIVLRSVSYEVAYEKPGEFEAFLAKEGVDHLVPQRQPLPVKETYSRNAKSLLMAGRASPRSAPDRAFGLQLELIAETDPYAGKPA